jgi:ribosomal protein L15
MMPILVGVGLVAAVLAIIALWPGDEKGRGDKRGASAAERAGRSAGAIAAAGEGEGGVKARNYDEPSAARTGARNPAVKLPPVGMAPDRAPEDDTPPVFESKEAEIAWYEKRLDAAKKQADSRRKFVDRLPAVRERIEKGPDPDKQLEAFEGRSRIVKDNYDKALAKVVELEKKLAELRGK